MVFFASDTNFWLGSKDGPLVVKDKLMGIEDVTLPTLEDGTLSGRELEDSTPLGFEDEIQQQQQQQQKRQNDIL